MKFLSIIIFFSSLLSQSDKDSVFYNFKDTQLDASFMKNTTNEWKVSYFSKDGKLVNEGRWTDVIRIQSLNGKKVLHRVQELYNKKGSLTNVWTNLSELKNLKPIQSSEFRPTGRFSYVEFSGKKIKGSWAGKDKELKLQKFENEFKDELFDWSLYGILLAAMPFEKGMIGKFPIYNGANGSATLVAEVVGEKKIGSFSTWEIKTNKNLLFWVTKKAPYVINLELKNPNGFRVFWESSDVR